MNELAVDSWTDELQRLILQDRPRIYQEASAGVWISDASPLVYESNRGLVFDLASLTKGLFTAPKIFEFSAEYGIPLGKPIKYFASQVLSKRLSRDLLSISLSELLSHSSGLSPWMNTYTECMGTEFGSYHDKLIFHLNRMKVSLKTEQYSDVGFLLLGLLLETETGKSLQTHLADWNQRSGSKLQFSPVERPAASTGFCGLRARVLAGEVHDENCAFLGGATGHAGLFGTLDDVKIHLKWLLESPLGRYFLHENALSRRLIDGGRDGLLGLRQGNGKYSCGFGGGFSVGHLGFTGTAFWIEPTTRSFVIHLTNRVIVGRRSRGIMESRKKICDFAGSVVRAVSLQKPF
jgi:CubicO group peptidase (beta-lactamase class C family)